MTGANVHVSCMNVVITRSLFPAGTLGIGGLSYILRCINSTPPDDGSQWQWLLGRLYVLDRFIEEYPDEFYVVGDDKKHYNRVVALLIFIKPLLQHDHTKVARMARRVFYVLSKMQVHDAAVFREIIDLLGDLQTMVQVHMKRKLLGVAEEHYRGQQEDGATGQPAPVDEPIFLTPSTSACSTPRSTSPVSLSPQPSLSVPKSATQSLIVPPNSPSRRMKTKLRRWRVSCQHESVSTNSARDRVSGVRHRSPPLYRSRRPISTDSIDFTDCGEYNNCASGCGINDSVASVLPPSDDDKDNVDGSKVIIPEGGATPQRDAVETSASVRVGELVSSGDDNQACASPLLVAPSTSQATRPVDFGSEFSFGGASRQAGKGVFT